MSTKDIAKGTKNILTEYGIPGIVIDSAKSASGKFIQSKTYKPIVGKDLEKTIKGFVVSVHFGKKKSQNSCVSLFSLSHAHLIFQFSSGEWVRCEISSHLDGVAVFIDKVGLVIFDEAQQDVVIKNKKISLNDIIKASEIYSEHKYHLRDRNCFDYCEYMTDLFCDNSQPIIQEWKKSEIEKVGVLKYIPDLLKKA